MRVLVESLYRATDMLLGDDCQNPAEAKARAYWARRQVQICKITECDLARRSGRKPANSVDAPRNSSSPTANPGSCNNSWLLDVLDDLTQFASLNGLEETRMSLINAHTVAADQLSQLKQPALSQQCYESPASG